MEKLLNIWVFLLLLCFACSPSFVFATNKTIHTKILFLTLEQDHYVPLSLLDSVVKNPALPGASMAVKEIARTGKFTGNTFELLEKTISKTQTLDSIMAFINEQKISIIVADLPKIQLLLLAQKIKSDGLIFNIRAKDNALRNQSCQKNLLHIAPSRSMLTDALSQYLIWKKWDKWLLVVGRNPQDRAYLKALKHSAKKFHARIVEVKPWKFKPGARQTDSGHFLAQQEVPIATRGKAHDILLVADETDEFGEYVPYLNESPRPVAGTQGLIATNWHRAHEQWGGTQLQRRFIKHANRAMQPRDYSAWLAVSIIGKTIIKQRLSDHHALQDYLLSEHFKVGGFKGVPLSFRKWNGQMRQPILIVSPRMLVSVSPQDKFLHQTTTLDTLGFDQMDSSCQSFATQSK